MSAFRMRSLLQPGCFSLLGCLLTPVTLPHSLILPRLLLPGVQAFAQKFNTGGEAQVVATPQAACSPTVLPSAPTNLTAKAGNASVILCWGVPANNGCVDEWRVAVRTVQQVNTACLKVLKCMLVGVVALPASLPAGHCRVSFARVPGNNNGRPRFFTCRTASVPPRPSTTATTSPPAPPLASWQMASCTS
jgi:hypothetical protein